MEKRILLFKVASLICLLILFSSIDRGWGQNIKLQQEQKQENLSQKTSLTPQTHKNLVELSRLYEQEYRISYQKALDKAKRFKLPTEIRSEYVSAKLVGFDSFDQPIFIKNMDIISARTTSTNAVWPGGTAGLSLTGVGLSREIEGIDYARLGMWEVFVQRNNHQEYNGRVRQGDGEVGDNGFHASFVTGQMIAQGINPSARGMASAARLDAFTSANDLSEMALAASRGMLVSNHSYGPIAGFDFGNYGSGNGWYWFGNINVSEVEDFRFGRYNNDARTADEITFNAPYYLPVWAAGNDRNDTGPEPGGIHYVFSEGAWQVSTVDRQSDGGADGFDCISAEGLAKNLLSIGAINGLESGYTGPEQVSLGNFSAFGPTDDGRIKPDLVGHGVDVFSTGGATTTTYGTSQGTSFSAPNVSGSLILLQEHYQNLKGEGVFMRAATLKGLAIHTANEAGTAEGPDYRFGWGVLNTAGAARVITNNGTTDHIIENTLLNGETFTQELTVTAGQPLTVTLSWTDLPGAPFTSNNPTEFLNNPKKILVHDLDVRVSNGTNTFEPYILDPANPSAPATRGDNFRDNLEKIYIAAPSAGTYTVSITHKGTLSVPQGFSLIISGATISGDQAPVVANPIQDIVVTQGAENTILNISNLFDDPDNDNAAIIKAIIANTNSNLVTPTIVGNTLTLAYNPSLSGLAYITIRATSNGKTAQAEFAVFVIPDPVVTLYNQSSAAIRAVTTGLPSMQFTNFANDELRIADDFEIPSGQIWEVTRIKVEGFNNAGTAIPNVRLILFEDDNGKPGNEIYDTGSVNPIGSPTDFDFEIALPQPQILNAGTYWVTVMAIHNFISATNNNGTVDGWYWLLGENPIFGNVPQIIQIDNAPFDEDPISEWTNIVDIFNGLPSTALNMLFSVSGKVTYTAPTALAATQVTPVSFKANWLEIENVDKYRLDVSNDNFATFILEKEEVEGTESSFTVEGLVSGEDYQYRLQFLDANGISELSNVISVTTCVEPDQPASNIVFNNTPAFAMRVNWNPGNGRGRIVLVKQGASFTEADLPVDGVSYTANPTFGSGSQVGTASVVYIGNELTSLLIFNLQDGVTYSVAIVEFGCDIPYYNTATFVQANNVVTSLEANLTLQSLELSPNPAEDYLQVRLQNSQSQVVSLHLIDQLGRQLQVQNFGNNNGSIDTRFDTSKLPRGMYFLKIQAGEAVTTRKIILK